MKFRLGPHLIFLAVSSRLRKYYLKNLILLEINMKNLAKSIFIFLLMAMSSSVWASSFNVADITIENSWSRATVKGIPNGVSYFALHNNGSEDDKLLSVSAQVSDRAELHTHEKDGDVMRMRQVEYIKVPAGEMVELKPSGL